MRILLVVVVIWVFSVVDCLNFPDGIEESRHSVEETRLLEKTFTSEIRKSQLEESDEEMYFNDQGTVSRQRNCSPTPSCVLAGGHCIKRDGTCYGTRDPSGCRRRRCTCCIPDVTPPTCPPPLTCPPHSTCPPIPTCPAATSSSIKNAILEWSFVGEDHFVRFNERMTWDEAQDFCADFALELYQPKNTTKVARYLADNFEESHDQFWTFLGGRANGTHVLWLSGEIVSSDEPWGYYYYGTIRTGKCLAVSTYPSDISDGKSLQTISCTHIDNIAYFLCGESHDYTLTWHSVGEDSFAWYNHRMDWDDSRSLCKSFGLDLYQLKNTTAVSKYLYDLVSALDNPLKTDSYFWVGAKGNGTDVVWLSGDVIPRSLFENWQISHTPYGCVFTYYRYRLGHKVMRIWECNQRNVYPLCG